MIANKCINHILCKKRKIRYYDYCYDCLTHFNKKIEYNINLNKNTCPLCLEDDENLKMIKLYNCRHEICYLCIYNIYWNKSYLKNKPKNPIIEYSTIWNRYIRSFKSLFLRINIIKKIEENSILDVYLYDYNELISNFRINTVPKILRPHLKELVFYQIKVNKFLKINEINKNKKIETIKKCPYCRLSNNTNTESINLFNSNTVSEIIDLTEVNNDIEVSI